MFNPHAVIYRLPYPLLSTQYNSSYSKPSSEISHLASRCFFWLIESARINSKRLIAMARKWQKLASMWRKRISMSRSNGIPKEEALRQQPIANKGTLFVYTSDGRCFSVPLASLDSPIFQELLKMSEDEYGLTSDGPITLPCDAVFINYVVSLIEDTMSKDVDKALLLSIANGRCSTSSCLPLLQPNQPVLVHGY